MKPPFSATVESFVPDLNAAPPTITSQPAGVTVAEGGGFSLSVVATGSAPLEYQWRRNGSVIPGAVAATLSMGEATLATAGSYAVTVANEYGSVESSAAEVVVLAAPVITSQPVGGTLNPGASKTFTVSVTGFPLPTFQWRKNDVNISGATSSSFTIPSLIESDEASYTVVVTNSAGTVVSSSASLVVNNPVQFTTQPIGGTIVEPADITLSVAVTGTAPITLQWFKDGVILPGETSSSLSLVGATILDDGDYTCRATNVVGTVESDVASVTVHSVPQILVQPVGAIINPGSPHTFSVTAVGTPNPTFQWRKNGVNISGATGDSYTIPSLVEADEAAYTVVVTNSAGSVTSDIALLTVNDPVQFTEHPASQTAYADNPVAFTVSVSATLPASYQWFKNGVSIPGATTPTFTISSATLLDAGTYFCRATNVVGSVDSNPAVLTVYPATVFHVIIAGQSNGTGGNAEIQSTSPHATAKMFNGGLRPGGASGDLASFTALVEDTVAGTLKGMSGQSVATPIADQLTPLLPTGSQLLFSVVAKNGEFLSNIAKPSTPFSDMIAQATAAKNIAAAAGKNYRCVGIVFIHGETDDQNGNANYGTGLLTFQSNAETDIKAATGQTDNIPLFACQQAGFYYNDTFTSANASTVQLYNVAVANPTKIVLMGPRYQFSHTDGPHVDAYGMFWHGGRYGKVLAGWINSGTFPTILRVDDAYFLNGDYTKVYVKFVVPNKPLQFDTQTTLLRAAYGFHFHDTSGATPTISSVSLVVPPGGASQIDTVEITLSAESSGPDRRISYARKLIDSANAQPIPGFGAGGNLKDSNPDTTVHGYSLANWCPAFNLSLYNKVTP